MEEGENDLDQEGGGPCLGAFGPGFLSGRTSITLISAPLPRLPRDPRSPVCGETRKAEGPQGAEAAGPGDPERGCLVHPWPQLSL